MLTLLDPLESAHLAAATRLARQLTTHPDDAEDLEQSAHLVVARRSYRDGDHRRASLLRTVRNLAHRFHRDRRHRADRELMGSRRDLAEASGRSS